MANFGTFTQRSDGSASTYINNQSIKGLNEANKAYELKLDSMFSRLHTEDYVANNPGGQPYHYDRSQYERVAFSDPSDLDSFLKEMADQGIDAVATSKKLLGQYLVEIPKTVDLGSLDSNSYLAQHIMNNGGDSISASDVVSLSSKTLNVSSERPVQTEYSEEKPQDGVEGSLYNYLTREMDALGTVINKAVQVGYRLDQYGYHSDQKAFTSTTDHGDVYVDVGYAKKATVINGDTVLIDGKLVTDSATINSIIQRHDERINDAAPYAAQASTARSTAAANNYTSETTAFNWNQNIHKVDTSITDKLSGAGALSAGAIAGGVAASVATGGLAGAGMLAVAMTAGAAAGNTGSVLSHNHRGEVYTLDFNNPNAVAQMSQVLASKGLNWNAPSSTHDSGLGDNRHTSRMTFSDGVNVVTVKHEHKDPTYQNAQLSRIVSNSEIIHSSIYDQKYVATKDFKTQAFCKDMVLDPSQAHLLQVLYSQDPGKFSYKEINAINSFSATGRASNLDFSEREALLKKLDSAQKSAGLSQNEKADWAKIKQEVALSDVEKAQKNDENLNGKTSFVRVDFALEELNNVANGINAAYNIANINQTFKVGSSGVDLMSKGNDLFGNLKANSNALNLCKDEVDVLNKVINARNSGAKNLNLTVEERFTLSQIVDKYENQFKSTLSAKEQADINNFRSSKVAKLTPTEKQAALDMISVKRELGVTMSMANFNAEKLLELNKAFLLKAQAAGIDVFKRSGGKWVIDVKKINALTPVQLRKLGISENTKKLLVNVNAAQIKGPDIRGALSFFVSLASKGDESGSIAEVAGIYNKFRTAKQYTIEGISTIRNFTRKIRKDGAGIKTRRIKKRNPYAAKPKVQTIKKPAKPNVAPKKGPKVVSRKELANRTNQAMAVKRKAIRKAARRERSIFYRYKVLKRKVLGRIANNPLGKAFIGIKKFFTKLFMKAAIYVGGAFFLIAAFTVIAVVVMQSISAFLEKLNPLDADTYQDTIAWKLYDDMLRPLEEDWIKDEVQDVEAVTDDRIHRGYGADYTTFQDYIKGFPDLVLLDKDGNGYYSDVYINPFYKDNTPDVRDGLPTDKKPNSIVTIAGTYNESVLTAGKGPSGHFDGEQVISFGANNNCFGKKKTDPSDTRNTNGYLSVESGHTSNIKDILCMVDVMYGMDLNDSVTKLDADHAGDTANGILGKTPAEMTWEEIKDNTKGFFKWLWNTIKSPFSKDTDYVPLKNFCNEHKGYGTICTYAETLFNNSHQEELAYEVKYYDTNPIYFNTATYGMLNVTSSLDQEQASVLGYCNSPVKKDFYLFWNTTGTTPRVSPFFWKNGDKGTNIRYPVDTGRYEVTIDMSKFTDTKNAACIKNEYNMGENAETYNLIKDTLLKKSECWKQTAKKKDLKNTVATANYESTGGSPYYEGNYWDYDFNPDTLSYHDGEGGWYDNKNDAINNAKDKVEDELNKSDTVKPEDKYYLDGDRSVFRKTYFEAVGLDLHYQVQERDKLTGTYHDEPIHYNRHTGQELTDGGTGLLYELVIATKEELNEEDFRKYFNGESSAILDRKLTDTNNAKWSGDNVKIVHPDGEVEMWSPTMAAGDNWLFRIGHTRKVADWKKQYRVYDAWSPKFEQKMDEFQRDCKGHEFTYCGGHICVHSHGVVYSFTNEQIDLMEMQDEYSGLPLADGFDLKDHRFDDIKGKVITANVKYPKNGGTAYTASITGGCDPPLWDPQGSASGHMGLNVKTNGGTGWGSGYAVRGSLAFHEFRDIFDVDCAVLKGDNIFPIKDCNVDLYEGWNEDNMRLALMKFCANWHEEYEFDIPQEISYGEYGEKKKVEYTDKDGNKSTEKMIVPYEYGFDGAGQTPLSEQDINDIVNALKDKYKSQFTSEREKAVRQTLGFVGKGHYNDLHKHDFLAEECEGLSITVRYGDGREEDVPFDGCCTAADERGFVNYIRRHNGKSAITSSMDVSCSYTGPGSALPADTIIHRKQSDLTKIVVPAGLDAVATQKAEQKRYIVKQIKEGVRDKYAVYIGVLNEDLKLSTGQVLKANVPIVVDLTQMNAVGVDGLGNVYLHGYKADNDFSKKSFTTYTWLTDDKSETYVKKFN